MLNHSFKVLLLVLGKSKHSTESKVIEPCTSTSQASTLNSGDMACSTSTEVILIPEQMMGSIDSGHGTNYGKDCDSYIAVIVAVNKDFF